MSQSGTLYGWLLGLRLFSIFNKNDHNLVYFNVTSKIYVSKKVATKNSNKKSLIAICKTWYWPKNVYVYTHLASQKSTSKRIRHMFDFCFHLHQKNFNKTRKKITPFLYFNSCIMYSNINNHECWLWNLHKYFRKTFFE